ncbi:hypothetical protein JW711_05145, partial [Candidatus Woesearchaeota archaeon]|nr:hypothetical protein [Candidatus Woesearchaeota archaeon]
QREHAANEMVLDHVYKMMVCPQCVKERIASEKGLKHAASLALAEKAASEVKKDIPAGWDRDDEEIEASYDKKVRDRAVLEQIDDQRVKYTCRKCKYQFTYHTVQMRPERCPYCSTPVRV